MIQTRDPGVVMTPERLGSLQPTRLSAARTMIDKMVTERWRITRPEFSIDGTGNGTARYHVEVTKDWSFEFVVFSTAPDPTAERTDRIIGKSWDMMGALLEGAATNEGIEQTKVELPKLYGGRAAEGTLIWCRANRSMRAFDLTVESLRAGRQPPAEILGAVCYLMRNTGLDGNGTFGTKSFAAYESDHPLRTPYHAQMLTSYLMREFSLDLAEHIAASSSDTAVPLDEGFRRFLGLGNASGLGLILFMKNHPQMADRWLTLREEALAAARSLTVDPDDAVLAALDARLAKAAAYRAQDRMRYTYQPGGAQVSAELERIREILAELREAATGPGPLLDGLYTRAAAEVSTEGHEFLCSLLIDLAPVDIDDLAAALTVPEATVPSPNTSIAELRTLLAGEYGWAAGIDLAEAGARHYAWYKSANAEEPRRGPLADLPEVFDDMTLDLALEVQELLEATAPLDPASSVGQFLGENPRFRAAVERMLTLRGHRYHSIRANLRHEKFNPSHIIRLFNSAFYGLDKTKEDGPVGVVGVMFHGAPTPADIAAGHGRDWPFPAEPEV